MKQRWFAVIFIWSVVVGSVHAAEPPTKFMLAYGAIGGNAVPLWIAKEQGIFRKYNLDPQLIYIIAGRAVQSMLAGDVQVGLLGATHVTNAVTAGGDMTMLLGLEEKLNFVLVVRPGIKTAEDLKGKKIAIGTPSGSLSLATYVGLDHLGLVPRRDRIVLLGTGSSPERLAALFAGGIDGALQSRACPDRHSTRLPRTIGFGQRERPVSILGSGYLAQVYAGKPAGHRKSCQDSCRRGGVRAKTP